MTSPLCPRPDPATRRPPTVSTGRTAAFVVDAGIRDGAGLHPWVGLEPLVLAPFCPDGKESSGSAHSRMNLAFLVPSGVRTAGPRAETEWPRMTVESLKDCNKKILARMAKDQGIVGWHAMRKDQLIRALTPPPAPCRKTRPSLAREADPGANPPPRDGRPAAAVAGPARCPVAPPRSLDHACVKDRIIVMVRDPYWLHAYWELSRTTLGPGPGRPRAGLAHRPADPPADGRHQRGHHLGHRAARPRHRDPRRRQQLVHRRHHPAPVVPGRHRLPRPPRQVLRPGPLQRRHHAQGRRLRRPRRELVERPGAVPARSTTSRAAERLGQLQDLRELFEERLRRPMHSLSLQSLGTGALPPRPAASTSRSTPS